MLESHEEAELVRRAQRGDLDAFGELVARYERQVRACLAVRLSSTHDAEDLAQEVFLIAFRKVAQYDPERPLGPWLRGIAMNLLRNYRRKLRALPVRDLEALAQLAQERIEQSHAHHGEESWLSALEHCLEKLDHPARQLLSWRYAEGMSLAELVRRLQRKHSAVTMWLYRTRLTLRECIERKLKEAAP